MAKQTINLGTPPAGADGDTVRTAFSKAEANFTEIYSAAGSAANSKALNGLTGAADRVPYFTGAGALSLATLTAYARTLIDDPDAATARTTLGLGSAATRTSLGTTGSLYSRDSILGTVSQSAGVPTGAIIESGSNANGKYVRFADGTQICTRYRTYSGAVFATALGALYERSPEAAIPFPAAFVSTPITSFTCAGDTDGVLSAAKGVGTTTSWPQQKIVSWTSAAQAIQINMLAIGRWF